MSSAARQEEFTSNRRSGTQAGILRPQVLEVGGYPCTTLHPGLTPSITGGWKELEMINRSGRGTRMLLATVVVLAQSLPFSAAVFAAGNSISIAGRTAFSVTGQGSMTATQRAQTMQKNIDNALVATAATKSPPVSVTWVNGSPVITLGGFYVATVDKASARAAGTTPALLAQKWSSSLRTLVQNKTYTTRHIAQLKGGHASAGAAAVASSRSSDYRSLTSNSTVASTGATTGMATTAAGSFPYYRQGRLVYVPQGMTLPVVLTRSLSSSMSRPGDPIEARLTETVNLGETNIPQGSTVLGQVTEVQASQRMAKSGTLGIKFNKLRTPDGSETPITAHIIGGVSKFKDIDGAQGDVYKGETTETKIKKAAIHGAIGAGSGVVLGTAIGAIAGGGRGAGKGALSGAALGGVLGIAESFLLRKGNEVSLTADDKLTLHLDAPATLAVSGSSTY